MKPIPDLIGKRYGKLTVAERLPAKWVSAKSKKTMWRCACDCGGERVTVADKLYSGHTTSCGCGRRTHNHSYRGGKRTPTYTSWQNMIGRCTQPNATAYDHYRKRGITVCDRWRRFENFLTDMGERPSRRHTIERIDNDGDYEPNNCRWATRREQGNNRSTNRFFTYRGTQYTIAQLSRLTGVNKELLRSRLVRSNGWTVEGAVATPVIPRKNRRKLFRA